MAATDLDFLDAVEFGDLDGARMYSGDGQDVDLDFREPDGRTALIIAAYYGHVEILKWLLSKGADSTIQDNWGKTAQDYAIERGHPETVLQLAGK